MAVELGHTTPQRSSTGYECTRAVGASLHADLPHTADVQVHSWGASLPETMEQAVYGMFDVITRRDCLKEDAECLYTVNVCGTTYSELLYNLLDELLFRFSVEPFVAVKRISITECVTDQSNTRLRATCHGESFSRHIHPCGTEVKAITKSNMFVSSTDAYVILDI